MKRCSHDYTGNKFGFVTIVGRAKDHAQPSGRVRVMWDCVCVCGNRFVCRDDAVKMIESCGCKRNKDNALRLTKHSEAKTRLYRIYSSMVARCYNEKASSYNRYGGRGITVCEEWQNDNANFFQWARETGYNEKDHELSLERIDVNGNYCPENCTWVKIKDQYNNRQNTIRIGNLSLKQFCDRAGLKYSHVRNVYYRTSDIVYALGFTNSPAEKDG